MLTTRGFRVAPAIFVRALDDATSGGDLQEVRQEVAPISIARGVLAIRPSSTTFVGDANLDGALDISDPIAILAHLFLGGDLQCLPAADADSSGSLEITDPILILSALFLGDPPASTLRAREVDCF